MGSRLRWTSDFLVLASKAIAIVACVQGLEYPPDLHRTVQQDLRAWASYLDEHPGIAADLELASLVQGGSDTDGRVVDEQVARRDRPSSVPPIPTYGAIR